MFMEYLDEGVSACQIPQEVYNFSPPDEVVFSPGGKIALRNVFSFQSYSPVEQEKLKRLKIEIEKDKVKLLAHFDDAELLRIIHGSGYKTRKALKAVKESIETQLKFIPYGYKILFSKSLDILVNHN